MTFDSYEGMKGILDRLNAIEQKMDIIRGSETYLINPMARENPSDGMVDHAEE